MNRPIHVYSVMHTGTHFVIEFLRQHSHVKQVILERELYRKAPASNGVTVYHHHHMTYREWPYAGRRSDLPEVGPIIIPMRDPMKAALSMSTRGEANMPTSDIAEGYKFLFNMKNNRDINTLFRYKFLPIDTNLTYEQRYKLLCDVLKHAKLPIEPYVKEYAKAWLPQNKLGDHPRKRAYAEGRLKEAISEIPEFYQFLKNNEQTIKPFLKQLGYKNLPWWEERETMDIYDTHFKDFKLYCRQDTWDENIAHEVIIGDFYFMQQLKDQGGEPMKICDVGGHIGSFALWAHSLWPEATICTYEANPDNYDIIDKNTKNVQNIRLYKNAMIGSDKDFVTFAKPGVLDPVYTENTGGGSIRTDKSDTTDEVPAVTIKHALEQLDNHIHLLKFDCEGAEGEILEYARDNDMLQYIDWIRGEWHGNDQLNRCYAALKDSHEMSHVVKAKGIGFFIAHRIT